MMTRKQYLLLKLSEECAEVSQRCSKQIQFGRDEIQKSRGNTLTNDERLTGEITDLCAVIQMLNRCGEITLPKDSDMAGLFKAKRKKIEKYLKYSRSLGRVGRAR